MLVRDVMVAPVITVTPSTAVKKVAELFLEKRISAAPVVESDQRLVGIVSEGDLLHRVEAGTERHHSWWLKGFIGDDTAGGGICQIPRSQGFGCHDPPGRYSRPRDAAS